MDNTRVCLIGALAANEEMNKLAEQLNIPVLRSETGAEVLIEDTSSTYFILQDFEGPVYEAIRRKTHK